MLRFTSFGPEHYKCIIIPEDGEPYLLNHSGQKCKSAFTREKVLEQFKLNERQEIDE